MDNNSIDAHTHNKNSIQENVNRIGSAKNWNALLRKRRCSYTCKKQF